MLLPLLAGTSAGSVDLVSIYALKPRFQDLLRPLVRRLAGAGVTANQVTLLAAAISVALGLVLTLRPEQSSLFLLLPLLLFLRMALNAIDGMLAREFGQKSALGAYLNELCDVVSDAFLYLPFAFQPHFDATWVGVVIVLAVVSEMAGTVAVMTGASRRYDGPLGKSDRAFVFGALGLAIGLGLQPAPWIQWLFPALALLLALTIANRVRGGLAELRR
ncbi:MAG TPA: CDP-alcohol phosphatidyltransferase family protein [Burkholderiales bacterium]|nr:CDP-alcohol phosphatidyltransferase family protein [Burkholderiales bacterium]